MSMKMNLITYAKPTDQILAIPDHYVALAFTHEKATAGVPGLAVLVDGRYVIKAGTFYPKNDATAIGVVLNDYDATDGDVHMAVVVHGFIKESALPVAKNVAVVLPQITFVKAIV